MKKNKKKIASVGVTCLLTSGLLLGSIDYASHTFALTKAAAAGVKVVAEQAVEDAKEKKEVSGVSKEESVYVTLDASGKKQSVIVSDWLKNSGINGTLKDVSNLNDIRNTKGDEKFTQNGNEISWEAGDQDIYYQGTTEEELPVGIEITYKLDGKELAPEELAGKSGRLEMIIRYINTSRESVKVDRETKEVYTPFLMATGMILPVEKFKNVSVDNGEVLSEGDNDILVAYGMPGLKESLQLEDIDFGDGLDADLDRITEKMTDTVTVTADVTEFELGQTYTVATATVFKDLDFGDISAGDELDDKMDELQDAASELVDGSDKIQENLNELNDKFGDYSDAIDTLDESIATLDDGSRKINEAAKKYTNSTDKLLGAVTTYVDGAKTFAGSTKTYSQSTKKLVDGVGQLFSASSAFPKSYEEFHKQLDAYTTGVNTLLSRENMDGLSDAASSLKSSVETVDKGLKQVQSGVESLSQGAGALNEQKENADSCIQALQVMQKQYEAMAASETDEAKKAQYQQLAAAAAGSVQYMQGAQKLAASLADGSQDLAAALSQIEAATNTESKEQNLYTGLAQLSQSADAISENAKTLRGYKEPLMTASATIDGSVSTIVSKLDEVYKNGMLITANNKKLESAADTISSNAGLIKENSKKLTNTSGTFRDATKTLANGTGKLVNGVQKLVSSTGDVSDGIGKLADGAVELFDGMKTFKKDGTDKLVNTVNGIIDGGSGLENGVKAVDKAAKNYKCFSGISKGMDGKVKFVMTTKSIKTED